MRRYFERIASQLGFPAVGSQVDTDLRPPDSIGSVRVVPRGLEPDAAVVGHPAKPIDTTQEGELRRMDSTPEGSDVVPITGPAVDEEEVVPYHRPNGEAGFDFRFGVGEAMRLYWPVVVAAVVLFAGLATAVGLLRQPHYTARATLTVSQSNAGSGGLVGFADASASLAAGYSRAIDATRVVEPVARATGLPPTTVTADVSASPIPASPVIQVSAEADSESDAVRLANVASVSLITFVNRLTRTTDASKSLLNQFAQALERAARQRARLQSLEASGVGGAAVSQAKAQLDAAELESQALSNAYQQVKQNQATGSPLQVLSLAKLASSDRISKLELLILIGLLAGLAVGAALATWGANR